MFIRVGLCRRVLDVFIVPCVFLIFDFYLECVGGVGVCVFVFVFAIIVLVVVVVVVVVGRLLSLSFAVVVGCSCRDCCSCHVCFVCVSREKLGLGSGWVGEKEWWSVSLEIFLFYFHCVAFGKLRSTK